MLCGVVTSNMSPDHWSKTDLLQSHVIEVFTLHCENRAKRRCRSNVPPRLMVYNHWWVFLLPIPWWCLSCGLYMNGSASMSLKVACLRTRASIFRWQWALTRLGQDAVSTGQKQDQWAMVSLSLHLLLNIAQKAISCKNYNIYGQ